MEYSTVLRTKIILLFFCSTWSNSSLLAQSQQEHPSGVARKAAEKTSSKNTTPSIAPTEKGDDERDVLSAEYIASMRNAIYQVRKFCQIENQSTGHTEAYKLALAEAKAAMDAALGMPNGQLALNDNLWMAKMSLTLDDLGEQSGTVSPSDMIKRWGELEEEMTTIEHFLNAIVTGEVALRKPREVPVFPGASRLTGREQNSGIKVSIYQTEAASVDVANFYRQSLNGFSEEKARECGSSVCLNFTRDLGGSAKQVVAVEDVGKGTKITMMRLGWIPKVGAGDSAEGAGPNPKP
jgi:hypothetical protein